METKNRSYNYHLDIVPTWYHESAISNYYTYQYTFHKNPFFRPNEPGVVHFNYHIGGIGVEIEPRDEDLWKFLIHLCAIIGGTYALCQAFYNWASNFTPKFEY